MRRRKKQSVRSRQVPEPSELTRIHLRLAKALQSLRLSHGLSKKELALRMQTSRPLVVRMEQGKARPTLRTLHRAARVLGARLHVQLVPRTSLGRRRGGR
jgi:transcriptional regulator with XRE-family HTH domain